METRATFGKQNLKYKEKYERKQPGKVLKHLNVLMKERKKGKIFRKWEKDLVIISTN
jgi:hypothetical protein